MKKERISQAEFINQLKSKGKGGIQPVVPTSSPYCGKPYVVGS